MMSDARGIPEEVADQAIHWLLILQAGASAEQEARWRAWRQAVPVNERAWQRIEQVNGALRRLPSPAAHRALETPASPGRRQFIKGMAVVSLAAGGGWVAQDALPWQRWAAHYRTGIGEQREVLLADGTQLHLNTATGINHDPVAGRLALVEGEAQLLLPQRQKLVMTQGLAELGVGRYVVRDLGRYSVLSVLEGEARLRSVGNESSLVLRAGWCCRLYPHRLGDAAPIDDMALAWLQGMLVASDMKLADFLSDIARYCPGRVSCSPAAGRLRVAGTYPVADPERVWGALVQTLPLRRGGLGRLWVRFDLA